MNETEAQTQIDTLIGHREITLADGREIRVRAYGFMDGNKVAKIAGPLLGALREFFLKAEKAEDFSLTDLQAVFATDDDALVDLLAMASTLTPAEIAELNDPDGQALLWTWWNLNAGFFVRRLVQDHLGRAAAKKANPTAPPGSLPS